MTSLLTGLAVFLGLASALEMLAAPRPRWRTWFSTRTLLARAVLFAAIYGFWLGVSALPASAVFLGLGTVGLLVAASRIKQHLLQEPLVFLDLQFIGQILRYPSLYYGQVLLSRRILPLTFAGLLALLVLLLALWQREPSLRAAWPAFTTLALLLGPALLWLAARWPGVGNVGQKLLAAPANELNPRETTNRWGLFVPMLAHYCRGREEGRTPRQRAGSRGFGFRAPANAPDLPHVIAVQCESFANPARFFRDAPLLPAYEQALSSALAFGPLEVPAGGAYTMRTEFSFLTGRSPEELGCDRFNPYARAEQHQDPSLAVTLAAAGYHTHFVHPHDLRFFRRHLVMPALGFQHLHWSAAFAGAERAGPYVSDPAVARYVGELLRKSDEPHFVFAVSMENHGPWRPGRLGEPDADARDLYLQHLRNSDLMIGALLELGRSLDRAVVLCFYGDHSPILSYDFPRANPPLTDYFIHSSQPAQTPSSGPVPRTAHALPQRLLAACTATTSSFSDHLLPA